MSTYRNNDLERVLKDIPSESPNELNKAEVKKKPSDPNLLQKWSIKFKQNYPFNVKEIPSLFSSESTVKNYRGFLNLAGLILVRRI